MIRVIEVGPRDGLQNEKLAIPTDVKARFIRQLFASGIREIEATSFVSPKWVPQLGDAVELWSSVDGLESNGAKLSALVPNERGLERAVECGVGRIAVFTASSDAFTMKNINMTVEQSLAAFQSVIKTFRSSSPNGWVRGYVSTAFECPYAGRIEPKRTVEVASELISLGVDEVSIGDTIGVAVPNEVRILTRELLSVIPSEKLAYHFHDTRGTAIANVAQAIEQGIRAFDSSAAGLGGCPYAPGAGGNLATEDLVYFLERSGFSMGLDLKILAKASLEVLGLLQRSPVAKAQLAALAV